MSGAERAAYDEADFGNDGIGNRAHHLGPGADDAAPLRVASHHKSVDVVDKNQWNQVLVAIHDEARSLFRRLGVNHTAKFHALLTIMPDGLLMSFLIGNHADGIASDAGVTA